MANSRSARKQIRSAERKRIRNRTVRSAVRTRINHVRRSLIAGETVSVEEELKLAVKALDKAAEKGILHGNNVRRRKSRIVSMAARLLATSGSEEELATARTAAAGGAKGKATRAAGAKTAKTRTAAAKSAKGPAKSGTAPAPKAAATSPTKAPAKPKAPAKSPAKASTKPKKTSAPTEA